MGTRCQQAVSRREEASIITCRRSSALHCNKNKNSYNSSNNIFCRLQNMLTSTSAMSGTHLPTMVKLHSQPIRETSPTCHNILTSNPTASPFSLSPTSPLPPLFLPLPLFLQTNLSISNKNYAKAMIVSTSSRRAPRRDRGSLYAADEMVRQQRLASFSNGVKKKHWTDLPCNVVCALV